MGKVAYWLHSPTETTVILLFLCAQITLNICMAGTGRIIAIRVLVGMHWLVHHNNYWDMCLLAMWMIRFIRCSEKTAKALASWMNPPIYSLPKRKKPTPLLKKHYFRRVCVTVRY